jgi:hypothetical protein
LKNLLIYSILSGITVYKGRQSYLFLKRKYVYARMLASEFIPSLRLKVSMMFFHILLAITYTLGYITMVLIQKISFGDYANEIMSLVLNHHLELLILILFLFIYRPRKFPEFFNLSYETFEIEQINNGDIYKCLVPSLQKLCKYKTSDSTEFTFIDKLAKNEKKFVKNEQNLPILVINPIFHDEIAGKNIESEINNNDSVITSDIVPSISITDKISIAYISKN